MTVTATVKRSILGLCCLFLVGCTQSTAEFHASIVPNRGQVPFEATITATGFGDSFTFHLPNETITQEEPTLTVAVDTLDWEATVETEIGGQIYTDTVTATGSNAPPTISNLIINGIRDRWYLIPRERTLLEFVVTPDAAIVDVDVWGSEFSQHYSIFIAPYDGTYHAVYLGRRIENACIVYPMYRSIPGEALPYDPTGLESGYPRLIGQRTNVWDFGGPADEGVEIPAQTGYVMVTAENALGQRTTVTFTIPIQSADYGG